MELAKSAKELTQRLAEEQKPNPKVGSRTGFWVEAIIADGHISQTEEELARILGQMKIVLQGTPGIYLLKFIITTNSESPFALVLSSANNWQKQKLAPTKSTSS